MERILRFRDRTERDKAGLFFGEGVRLVVQAASRGAKFERLVFCDELLMSPAGRRTLFQQRLAGVPVEPLSTDEFAAISLSNRPQGIGAVIRQRWQPLPQIDAGAGLCWVALHHVRFAGNLGAIIRTCDAVGAAGLILLGTQVDPFDPVSVRASMGSLFSQRLVRTSHDRFRDWARRRNVNVVGTSPQAGVSYERHAYRQPTVVLMGDERKGLRDRDLALCDGVVRIPMAGTADSLNLSVATGVILYEVFRQRSKGVVV